MLRLSTGEQVSDTDDVSRGNQWAHSPQLEGLIARPSTGLRRPAPAHLPSALFIKGFFIKKISPNLSPGMWLSKNY